MLGELVTGEVGLGGEVEKMAGERVCGQAFLVGGLGIARPTMAALTTWFFAGQSRAWYGLCCLGRAHGLVPFSGLWMIQVSL